MYLLLFLLFLTFEKETSPDCETLVSYLGSQNVFIGKVLEMKNIENESHAQIIFKVYKVYKSGKNEIKSNAILNIYSVQNIYGYEFEKGNIYMVFQNIEENEKLIIDGCTLTSKIKTKKHNNLNIFPSLQVVKDHNWGNRGKSDLSINWLIENK